VTAVEYQGASVAVTATPSSGDEVLALLPEEQFYQSPKSLGEAVSLCWDDGRLHRLQA
jgi:putative spermidine/putrescine transport system ATP-binding protein